MACSAPVLAQLGLRVCGKYKRMKYRGIICEKCGVEVTLSKVRRERMGHIELACRWPATGFPVSPAGSASGRHDFKELERVLYFENFVVVDPGRRRLSANKS